MTSTLNIRCCLCRRNDHDLERTPLPGTGWRCRDREACAQRVRAIVTAHREFGELDVNSAP